MCPHVASLPPRRIFTTLPPGMPIDTLPSYPSNAKLGGGRCGTCAAPGARAHPRKVMTFRGWGRGRQPHFGEGARPTRKAANAVGEGRGRFSRIGNRKGLRASHPLDRPSEPRVRLPSPGPAARGTSGCGPGPRSRSSLPAATGGCPGPPAPGPASGGGGRAGPLLPPARALPSPGRLRSRRRRRRCPLLQCESRRRGAGPGPGRPGNRDSTWRGAARRRAHPLSGPPPPARPRRRSPAEDPRRLVAASPRSPDTPARRPGLGLQKEGGRLGCLVEVGEGLRLGV